MIVMRCNNKSNKALALSSKVFWSFSLHAKVKRIHPPGFVGMPTSVLQLLVAAIPPKYVTVP